MPHPTDGSVWYTLNVFAGTPGFLRFDPKTRLSEFYAIPKEGIGARGGDIDKNGVLWGSGSNGTLISFDRRKCKSPLNGPNATGNHCPEGFAYHKYPGPAFEDFENGSAEASYYTWVDHHNTVGLGENVRSRPPISMTASPRSRTGRWSCCASRIRWASSPRVWTGASTTRMPAGRAAGCGARTATARRG